MLGKMLPWNLCTFKRIIKGFFPRKKLPLTFFSLGKISFKESEVLSPGSELASFETNFGAKIGLGICYDMRFPDIAQVNFTNQLTPLKLQVDLVLADLC
jgi:predicted amidohydrolase